VTRPQVVSYFSWLIYSQQIFKVYKGCFEELQNPRQPSKDFKIS
jgi:hypothetical protein